MRIKIQPLQSFGGAAEVLDIVGANALLGLSATFSYRLLDKDGSAVHHGQVQMNPVEYATWGSDDDVAAVFVAAKLGAKVVEIEPPYLGDREPNAAASRPAVVT